MDPADLEPTLRQVLSDLADLDLQYDEQRAALDHWPGPEVMKQQLAHELQERHRRDRAPYVHWLTELQHSIRALALCRNSDRSGTRH